MKTLKQKLRWNFACVALWQPKPYIAWSGSEGDGPLSWWFYKLSYRDDYFVGGLYQRTWLGNMWSDFWWKLSRLFK